LAEFSSDLKIEILDKDRVTLIGECEFLVDPLTSEAVSECDNLEGMTVKVTRQCTSCVIGLCSIGVMVD
jgi:hypothetical protein